MLIYFSSSIYFVLHLKHYKQFHALDLVTQKMRMVKSLVTKFGTSSTWFHNIAWLFSPTRKQEIENRTHTYSCNEPKYHRGLHLRKVKYLIFETLKYFSLTYGPLHLITAYYIACLLNLHPLNFLKTCK